MRAHIPNLLTCVRIVLAPWVGLLIFWGRFAEACAWCAVAGFTDAADGFLARRWGVASPVGTYLDPAADKLLMAAVALALGAAGILPIWLVALVFGRDLMILVGAALVAWLTPVRAFPPTRSGKISTIIQVSTVLVALASVANLPFGLSRPAAAALPACIGATAVGTVASGIDYLARGIRLMTQHRGISRIDSPDVRG